MRKNDQLPKRFTFQRSYFISLLDSLVQNYLFDTELSSESIIAWALDVLIQDCPQEFYPPIDRTWDTLGVRRLHKAINATFAKEITHIQTLRMQWLEQMNVELRTRLTDNVVEITFQVMPYLDIDDLIYQAIMDAKEKGVHVPYRYYRAIGLC